MNIHEDATRPEPTSVAGSTERSPKKLTVTITKGDWHLIEQAADSGDRTFSAVIQRLIRAGL